MTTVTISLPDSIAKQLDKETSQKGFATRSEFIRNLIRRYFLGEELTLEPFEPRPLKEIEKGLRGTGRYNEKFIRSLIKGLKDSSSYEGKTS